MSPTQLKAAEILLRKTLPDLTSTTISGVLSIEDARTISDDALAAIISGRRSIDITPAQEDPALPH